MLFPLENTLRVGCPEHPYLYVRGVVMAVLVEEEEVGPSVEWLSSAGSSPRWLEAWKCSVRDALSEYALAWSDTVFPVRPIDVTDRSVAA